ncbi:MAG TPA: peptidylprolyl isomerase [Usitatibacter sp.]|jgi:peptidyl-prolyl cis-trans isomerase SurA|nr:peptidylprolyl isomerase [Usitatibacter sp.]
MIPRSPIKRFLAACAAAAALCTQAQAPEPPAAAGKLDTRLADSPSRIVPVDRIVAVVNEDVITQNDLNERVALVVRQLQRQGAQLPPADALARQILERMINDRIQLQLAKENGIKVDDVTLDRTIERIAAENSMPVADFRAALERDGVKYSRFREDIRNEILIARLREHEVDNTVVVTDAEVETELARESKQATGDSEYQLSHILVAVPPQASADQIEARRQRALQALEALRRGANFAQIAAQFSDAPDALQGGNLGWRAAGRLPSLFLEVLERMKPGDVSDILKSPNGFHIVKLVEKRGAAPAAGVEQTHARHILLRAREGLSESEARDRLARLRERILAGADFGEMAKQNSEDSSAAKGGDLGWVAPGDTVPEFERVMNTLKPGEVSEPFQTPFGWHLVQVIERRSEALSEERKKAAAKQAIRARKADEAYQDWLRQQRDRAFVENRYDER